MKEYDMEDKISDETQFSDHDLLIAVNIKQDALMKQFSNHLNHHWMITIAALSAGFMGLASFIVCIIMLLVKS